MIDELYIVKLGGAAITDKTKERTLSPKILNKAMNELATIESPMIIIHGAGSFAHPIAKKYHLRDGLDENVSLSQQRKGISIGRTSLQELHLAVLEAANKAGIDTFSLPLSATLVTSGQSEIEEYFSKTLDHTLDLGFTPVLYGDFCMDTKSRFRVVSGDRIFKILSEKFYSLHLNVIFGTDIDGLFDKDPIYDDAELIPKVEYNDFDKVLNIAGDSTGTDVTGGMYGKLLQIKNIVSKGNKVYVVNIKETNRLKKTLHNEDTINTVFLPPKL